MLSYTLEDAARRRDPTDYLGDIIRADGGIGMERIPRLLILCWIGLALELRQDIPIPTTIDLYDFAEYLRAYTRK